MAHKFDRAGKDPYAEAARQVENRLPVGRAGLEADAGEDINGILGDAIVSALGDVAAQAFRHGINEHDRMKRLAQAIAHAAETVLISYQGEVDPEPALRAIQEDPRVAGLTPETKDELTREIEKTRQLENLVLTARRLPDLMDFAGSLGLHVSEDQIESGTVLVPGSS